MDIWAYYLTEYKKKQTHKNTITVGIIIALIVIFLIIVVYYIQLNKKNKKISNCNTGNCGHCGKCGMYENVEDLIAKKNANSKRLEFDLFSQMQDKNLHKVYYSDQLDPLITGSLYNEWGNRKPIYSQRTAYGAPAWETQNISKYGVIGYQAPRGLHEYKSDSYYKDVGVSPYIWQNGKLTNQTYDELAASMVSYDPNLYNNIAKAEYDQNQQRENINNILYSINAADDGIPQNWNLPSTPIINYNINNVPLNIGRDYYSEEGATPFTANGVESMFIPDHEPLMN
jgi:hypothetical protein